MGRKRDTIFFADTLSSQILKAKSVVLTCNHMAAIRAVATLAWKPNTDRRSVSHSLSDLCWIRRRYLSLVPVFCFAEKTSIAGHQHMLPSGCWSPAWVLVFPSFLTNLPSKTSLTSSLPENHADAPAKFSVTVGLSRMCSWINFLDGPGTTFLF